MQIGISRALSALIPINHELKEMRDYPRIGHNPGHDNCVEEIIKVRRAMKRKYKYDFICLSSFETELITHGRLARGSQREKSVKRLSRTNKVSRRHAKVRARFNLIIMNLKANTRTFNRMANESMGEAFQRIETVS